ncbi:hypothetical protein QQ045_025375 [Rhodiola kirilowii]
MLDALLGRNFASKCKSLIKAAKARIELIRKKRSAREKFLKKDIADLIGNGLDINAYGRTEGVIAELTMSSCYDFVEQCCDQVYGHLSEMRKESECPAECKAAVASLMFAAARVSDIPELRDLRELFQEKYGNSLQYSVNQKFVEDLSVPPPSTEKKIQLMKEIAAEYSVSWNCRDFEKQIAKPPVHTQEKLSTYGSVPVKDKFKADGGNSANQKDKNHIQSKEKYELSSDRNGSRTRSGDDDPTSLNVKESHFYKQKLQNETHVTAQYVPTSRLGRSSYRREQDGVHREHDLQDNIEAPLSKREMQQTLSHGRQVIHTPTERLEVQGNNMVSSVNVPKAGKSQDADNLKARSFNFNKMIPPPPYVTPPKQTKAASVSYLPHTGFNGKDSGGSSRDVGSQHSSYSNKTDDTRDRSHNIKYEKETTWSSKGMGDGHDSKRINQTDSTDDLPLPKPKSVRQYSSRSSTSHDEVIGNPDHAKMDSWSSSSRRQYDTKQGLQILFDNEPRVKDEERVLDKLLVHFSTKPTNSDPEKLTRKSDVQASQQMSSETSDTKPHVKSEVKPGNVTPLTSSHTRSVSLPRDKSAALEPGKVFARAASFQPDRPAKHVHPNLPNCDDLAARIAALRGSD